MEKKNAVEWLLEPLVGKQKQDDSIPDEVMTTNGIVIPPRLLITKKAPKGVIRPVCFADYVGQTKAKSIFVRYIEVVKRNKTVMPHIMIHGGAGCGKTTLARIIANQLKVSCTEVIGSSISSAWGLINLVKESKGGIIFIDEIHSVPRARLEALYSAIEDFEFAGEKILPFTLICATTEYGELLRTRKPFVDRFKINIELEPYDIATMELLLRKYAFRVHFRAKLTDLIYRELSKNSRLTPRTAIRLLDDTVAFDGDYKTVLENNSMIKDGYTVRDIKTLTYLSKNKSCGIDNICAYLNVPKQSYTYEIEPYLLQTNMIIRNGSGRIISEEGKKLLASLVKP